MPPPPVPAAFNLAPPAVARLDQAFLAAAAAPQGGLHLDLVGLPPVPGAFVRWLLLEAAPRLDAPITRVALWHATIAEALQLSGTTLTLAPAFANCTFAGIDLTDATLPGFEAIGGGLGAVRADRLDANGSVLLRGARADATYHHALPADAESDIVIAGGLMLCGAKIRGNLDLRGAKLGRVYGEPTLSLLADGLRLEGNALLNDGFVTPAEVRLNGSVIRRNLDGSDAELSNAGGFSLSAAGAEVKGTVYLARLKSVGTVRFAGATIGGELDARGARLSYFDWSSTERPDDAEPPPALSADGALIGGSVQLVDGFHARGAVLMVSAQIGNDLDCQSAHFDLPGRDALNADGATVAGITDLRDVWSSGTLRFNVATLKQGCDLRAATFDVSGSGECGVRADGAVVGDVFVWCEVRRVTGTEALGSGTVAEGGRTLWFRASGASVAEVEDDELSWCSVDRIDLRDCNYERLKNLTDDSDWRVRRLDREYAAWNGGVPERLLSLRRWRLEGKILCRTLIGEQSLDAEGTLGGQVRRFVPGPYLQLARVLQKSGFSGGASAVLLRLERNRTRYGGGNARKLVTRWVLDLALRYGQRPFRPLWFLVVWALVSGALLKWVHDTHGIVATGKDKVRFDWFFYALDTLVPVFDFGQKKSFAVEPLASWGGALVLFNALCGYTALAFLAAGLSGLVRTGKDGG